jgi:hypothetical protein
MYLLYLSSTSFILLVIRVYSCIQSLLDCLVSIYSRIFTSSGFGVGITVVESKSIYAYPFKVIHCGPVLFCCSGFSALWREVRLRRTIDVSKESLNYDAFGSCFQLN